MANSIKGWIASGGDPPVDVTSARGGGPTFGTHLLLGMCGVIKCVPLSEGAYGGVCTSATIETLTDRRLARTNSGLSHDGWPKYQTTMQSPPAVAPWSSIWRHRGISPPFSHHRPAPIFEAQVIIPVSSSSLHFHHHHSLAPVLFSSKTRERRLRPPSDSGVERRCRTTICPKSPVIRDCLHTVRHCSAADSWTPSFINGYTGSGKPLQSEGGKSRVKL